MRCPDRGLWAAGDSGYTVVTMAEGAIASNSVLESQGKYVQILNNKLVVRVYRLDNSKSVILVDPTSTVEVREPPFAAPPAAVWNTARCT